MWINYPVIRIDTRRMFAGIVKEEGFSGGTGRADGNQLGEAQTGRQANGKVTAARYANVVNPKSRFAVATPGPIRQKTRRGAPNRRSRVARQIGGRNDVHRGLAVVQLVSGN